MILPYFENLAQGLEARLQGGQEAFLARKTLALEIARLGVRLFSGRERVAWCGVLAPFDLLHAMDVTSCFVEFVGAMLASTGAVEPMLAEAERAGFSPDGCSYHRAVMGAALQGMMLQPAFLVGTSAPCTGGLGIIEALAGHFKKDLFVLHVPHHDTPANLDYLANQLRSMVDFVAGQTGRPLDRERLRAAVECTNRAREMLVEVYRLATAVPSPARPRDLVNFALVVSLLLGTEAAVDVARVYRDELAAKVRAGVGGAAKEEVRLLWIQNRIQFRHPLDEILEEAGAVVVMDEFNDITWDPLDPDDPFRCMAQRMVTLPLVGPIDRRVANLVRLAREYSVDGAINPCQWGCRQGTGARGLLAEGLRKVGVPVLNLEVDCIDPRSFSLGQMRTRLEAFIEMLLSGRREI